MRAFAANAIASSTRHSYQTAVKNYQLFCRSRSWDDSAAAITPASLAEWTAAMGLAGRVSSGTLSAYTSALSTWWQEECLSEAHSPFASVALARVRAEAGRQLDQLSFDRNKTRLPSPPLTPELLLQLEPALRSAGRPRDAMMLAAAHVGVHTVLRPSKILGSAEHPLRAPLFSAVQFFRRPHSKELALVSEGSADRLPDRFTIDLGPTKTDQAGKRAPKATAAPPAVRALWEWCIMRHHLAEPSDRLFALDGEPLLMHELLAELAAVHARQGFGPVRFTGKCFRRGGTSAAVAAGLPIADVQSRGGWRSTAMVARYTSDEAAEERRLELSRSMPSRPAI